MEIQRALLVVAALLSPFAMPAPAAAPASKPNILFLLSDDHSYPFLSTYGNPNVKTPVLDQLAADGMKFHRLSYMIWRTIRGN